MEQPALIQVPAWHGNDDENERYTTRETLAWCMAKAGVTKYDLDVAACAEAHCAERYYTKADNGLVQPWFGDTWCNPPFDNIPAWLARAWVMWRDQKVTSISFLMPANRTEQPFWQDLVEPFRDLADRQPTWLRTHYLPGRTRYGGPGNREGVGAGSPPFGSVLLVWGGR